MIVPTSEKGRKAKAKSPQINASQEYFRFVKKFEGGPGPSSGLRAGKSQRQLAKSSVSSKVLKREDSKHC